jgi:hypothetical protein
MRGFLRWSIRPAARGLLLAFAVITAANCVTAAKTAEEHACCAAMKHDCGAAKGEHDCCRTERPNPNGLLSAASAFQLLAPFVMAVDLGQTEPLVEAHLAASHAFDQNTLTLSGSPPIFLLISVFRL